MRSLLWHDTLPRPANGTVTNAPAPSQARPILSGMADAVRTAAERKADTTTRLEGDADVRVATASASGRT